MFWLRNALRATTACTFSTSQLPKVARTWCVLYILTSKCASRHNGVLRTWGVFSFFTCARASRCNGAQFFISHLATWLRTAALASLLFDPPRPQTIGKTPCFATFLPFRALGSSSFWDFLFFDLLSSSLLFSSLFDFLSFSLLFFAFHLSMLSEVWL